MITVSNELRHAMETRRNFINKATVTLADGTVLNLTHANFCMSGNKLTDSFSSGEAFSIGNAIAKSATMKINNTSDEFSEYDFFMAMVVIYVGIKLDDGTIEYLRKGTFTVTEPETPGSVIELSLVDDMYLFDRPYDNSTLVYPATLQSILSGCCLDCGVTIGFTQFDLYNQLVSEKPSGVTYRQVVSYVAQLAGYNARISTDNALKLVWYDIMSLDFDIIDGGDFKYKLVDDTIDGGDFIDYTTTNTLDGGNFTELQGYHNLYSIKDLKVATDDVVITGVSVTVGDTTKTSGENGYMIAIKDNPLATGIEQLVANHLATKLVSLTFRPFSCKNIADPRIEVGDIAFLHDRKGNTYKTLITDVTFTTNSYTDLECKAESPLKNSSTYFSQTANAVVQARRNTEKQLTTYDLAVQSMNMLAQNAMGAYWENEIQEDNSIVYFISNKKITKTDGICHFIAGSKIWKMTGDGFFLSQDGGLSWTSGFDSNGNAVFNVLSAIGIVCDWIKGGTLTLGGSDNVNGLVELYDGGQKRIDTNTITNIGSIGDTATLGYHSADGTQLAYTFTKGTETSYENRTIAGDTTTELATSIATVLSEVCEGILDVTSSGNIVTTSQVKPGVGMVWFVLNGMSAIGANVQVAVLPKLIVKLDKSGVDINSGVINLGGGVFRVNADGSMNASNADITGKITSSSGSIGGFNISSNILSSYGQGMIGVKLETNTGKVSWSWNNSEGSYSSFRSGSSSAMPPNMAFWAGAANGIEGIYVTNSAYTEWGGMSSWIRHGSQQIQSNDKGYVTWSGGSDARIKRDVVSLENIQTRIFFEKVEPKIFKYTEEYRKGDDKTYFGVIAQDMEKIFDDLEIPINNIVMETDDGWKFVNYQEFHGFELAGIKDLYETIDKQQAEIDELKKQVKLLIEKVGE